MDVAGWMGGVRKYLLNPFRMINFRDSALEACVHIDLRNLRFTNMWLEDTCSSYKRYNW